MKSSTRHLIRSITAAIALTGAAAAHATLVTFEDPTDNFLFLDGDAFTQQGVGMVAQNLAADGGFAGALVNGADPGGCGTLTCPTNNASTYYAAVDAGILRLGGAMGPAMRLFNFQAAFLGANGEILPGISGLLGVEADRADGSFAFSRFALNGPDANGNLGFATFDGDDEIRVDGTGSVFDGGFVQYFFFAYTCDASINCQAFSDNRAQFAIDNIAIPEPSSWLLAGLSLGAAGFATRRSRAQGNKPQQSAA